MHRGQASLAECRSETRRRKFTQRRFRDADVTANAEALSHAGARAVVTDLAEITTALRAEPSKCDPTIDMRQISDT
jgi:hypothetical protein